MKTLVRPITNTTMKLVMMKHLKNVTPDHMNYFAWHVQSMSIFLGNGLMDHYIIGKASFDDAIVMRPCQLITGWMLSSTSALPQDYSAR